MTNQPSQFEKELNKQTKKLDEAVNQVLSKSTKKTLQSQTEEEELNLSSKKIALGKKLKSVFSKMQLQSVVQRIKNKELNSAQRKQALNIYMIMKNSNACTSNPSCRIGNIGKADRATFHGDDIDYGGYAHKYDEPDSDRGATDE